jgi:hypothetical protein
MGFEFEKKEMWNENKIDREWTLTVKESPDSVTVTVPMWQVKIMLGAIDKSYDFQGELSITEDEDSFREEENEQARLTAQTSPLPRLSTSKLHT